MKKLITCIFALFLTAGVAYAQKGNDGPVVNNIAVIEQTTENNQGNIVQRGTSNEARIGQGKLERPWSFIRSEGPYWSPGLAVNNEAFVRQIGRENLAGIKQGIAEGTARGATEVRQIAKVYQNGNENFGQIAQGSAGTAINNSATLRQNGISNTSYIVQGSDGGYAYRNEAGVRQNGNHNFAQITQGWGVTDGFGAAFGSTAKIRQLANGNSAKIFQGSEGNQLLNSDATIFQYSDNNRGIIDMAGNSQSASIIQSN